MSRRGRLEEQKPVTDVEELHAPGEWVDKPQRWLIRTRRVVHETYAYLTWDQADELTKQLPYEFGITESAVLLRDGPQQEGDLTDIKEVLRQVQEATQ